MDANAAAENPVVACDGGAPVTGHPRVFLTFQPGSDRIVCPYCSRVFTPNRAEDGQG